MKCVLVTGARGLIGQHAIAPLLARGYEVHAITSSESRTAVQLPAETILHKANLLHPEEPRALIAKIAPTHLLHLAWVTEHGKFWTAPSNLDWVGASLNLLRAFREAGGQRAVMAGTCAEYEWKDAVQREGVTPLVPATLYGVAKDSLRRMAEAYARQEGISLAWGRVFFLYGPHEAPARLVPAVIRALLANEPALMSHGQQIRDFMHTSDVGRGFAALLDSTHEGAINVASGEGRCLCDVAAVIGEILKQPDLIKLGAREAPKGDPPSIVADASLLHDKVGFQPSMTLREGLEATIKWWQLN